MNVLVFLLGLGVVLICLRSAVSTVVLPRGENVAMTRWVFDAVRMIFRIRLRRTDHFADQDRILAMYAPVSLLGLAVTWVTCVGAGYALMYWAVGAGGLTDSLILSGSSLLTLGFERPDGSLQMLLAFSEATIGLGLVALLIAFLPAMYAAFSKRETAVALLEVYAGSPPSSVEMIVRIHRIRGLAFLGEEWSAWEQWFAELEESHTSQAALAYFRSPNPERSWVTAAGTVLDAAALTASTLDVPPDPRANLCIRAGYLALRSIAAYFMIPFDPDPIPTDPISIERAEFDAAYDELAATGVPLRADRDQAWRDFAGWRVNYDAVLLALADLVLAPPAMWSSDRATLPSTAPKTLKRLRWR